MENFVDLVEIFKMYTKYKYQKSISLLFYFTIAEPSKLGVNIRSPESITELERRILESI